MNKITVDDILKVVEALGPPPKPTELKIIEVSALPEDTIFVPTWIFEKLKTARENNLSSQEEIKTKDL